MHSDVNNAHSGIWNEGYQIHESLLVLHVWEILSYICIHRNLDGKVATISTVYCVAGISWYSMVAIIPLVYREQKLLVATVYFLFFIFFTLVGISWPMFFFLVNWPGNTYKPLLFTLYKKSWIISDIVRKIWQKVGNMLTWQGKLLCRIFFLYEY